MFPLRLVEWFFTTPIIISLVSCHLKQTKANLVIKRAALSADWAMIIAGFFEQRYPDPLGALWLGASCVRSPPHPKPAVPSLWRGPDGVTDEPIWAPLSATKLGLRPVTQRLLRGQALVVCCPQCTNTLCPESCLVPTRWRGGL
jgi:hypothetical protein